MYRAEETYEDQQCDGLYTVIFVHGNDKCGWVGHIIMQCCYSNSETDATALYSEHSWQPDEGRECTLICCLSLWQRESGRLQASFQCSNTLLTSPAL